MIIGKEEGNYTIISPTVHEVSMISNLQNIWTQSK